MRRLSLGRYDVAAYLFYMAYSASSVAVPIVLYELSRELGFPLSGGGGGMSGALQISRGAMMVLSMVVCGFTAARFGKVNALLASVLAMGVGITLVAFSQNYWFVFLVLALAGFGEGHIEGLGTPFIQDAHSDDDPARYVIFGHGFWSLGIVLASLVIGFMLYCDVSWRTIVVGCGAFCLVPVVWLSRCENRYRDSSVSSAIDVWKKTKAVLKCPRFYLFFVAMLFAGGGEFVFTFWTPALIRLEFADSAFMSGLGSAMFSIGMIAGRLGPAFVFPQKHLDRMLLAAAFAGAAVGLAIILACHAYWLICAALFFIGLFSGPLWPSSQSLCCDELKELDSNIIFIVLSCAGIPGASIFTWIVGATADVVGLRLAMLWTPICYGIYIVLIRLAMRSKAGGRNLQVR